MGRTALVCACCSSRVWAVFVKKLVNEAGLYSILSKLKVITCSNEGYALFRKSRRKQWTAQAVKMTLWWSRTRNWYRKLPPGEQEGRENQSNMTLMTVTTPSEHLLLTSIYLYILHNIICIFLHIILRTCFLKLLLETWMLYFTIALVRFFTIGY